MDNSFLFVALGFSVAVNIVMYAIVRSGAAQLQQALQNAARADERAADTAKIHQELLSRPVQALIPMNSIEVLGQAIIQYLEQGGAPIIFPKKGPIQ